MIIDTGSFLAEGAKPIDPSRLASALRTLARVLEIARPVLEQAPRWGWVAGIAVNTIISACVAYADRLDASGTHPDVHGWRTDAPSEGWHLVTTAGARRWVISCLWRRNEWIDQEGAVRDVVAWQPMPPPYRGES